ncbi:Hypothetical predicted protein [Octopus vulgaris]|uniref:Uncharacterized protein n=1 Tax=Octopus vulgaris TaxID=6645 RepID=A0AA36F3V6_OCTVU|nr:Hypothetical predicted protein [Octopus vulgaris]
MAAFSPEHFRVCFITTLLLLLLFHNGNPLYYSGHPGKGNYPRLGKRYKTSLHKILPLHSNHQVIQYSNNLVRRIYKILDNLNSDLKD